MIGLLVLLTTAVFLNFLFLKKRSLLILSGILLSMLLLLQNSSTTPTNFDRTKLTEMEKVEQIRRMNEYPPFAYRLANILEARQETITYFKLEKNFIAIFDLSRLFGEVWMFVLLPFFIVGLMWMIRLHPGFTGSVALPPIILLTLLGHQNLYGSISLFPLIYCAVIYGAWIVVQKGGLKSEK